MIVLKEHIIATKRRISIDKFEQEYVSLCIATITAQQLMCFAFLYKLLYRTKLLHRICITIFQISNISSEKIYTKQVLLYNHWEMGSSQNFVVNAITTSLKQ